MANMWWSLGRQSALYLLYSAVLTVGQKVFCLGKMLKLFMNFVSVHKKMLMVYVKGPRK